MLSANLAPTTFGYDRLSQITRVTDASGSEVRYGYSARRRTHRVPVPRRHPGGLCLLARRPPQDRVRDPARAALTRASYSYDPAGRLSQATGGNGVTTTSYAYDGLDHLRELRTQAGSVNSTRFQYLPNHLGLRRVVTETLGLARTLTYTYDGLDRLTSAAETGATTASYAYSYDKAGNRTDGGFTYDATNQRLGYYYDAAGNMTEDEAADYTYDALNRQTSVTRLSQPPTSYQ